MHKVKKKMQMHLFLLLFLYKKEKDPILIGDDYEPDSEACYNDKHVTMVTKKYIRIITDKATLCHII